MTKPYTSPHLSLAQLAKAQLVLVGIGREGVSSYEWLRAQLPEAKILAIDDAPLSATFQETLEQDPLLTWQHSSEFEAPSDSEAHNLVIVKAPGVPITHPVVAALLAKGAQVTSNTQLFFDNLPTDPRVITIGVTGTKGKSTTTTAIHHVLSQLGFSAVLAGNIGIPPLSALAEITAAVHTTNASKIPVVLELSAHQLRELANSPDIAVVLEVVPEHLDYYPDFASYFAAKTGLVSHQKASDVVIFNPELASSVELANYSPARQLWFTTTNDFSTADRPNLKQGELTTTIKDNAIWWRNHQIINLDQLKVVGAHTIMNLLPSVAIAGELGAEPTAIAKALASFSGLEHRLELIAEHHGVKFYDDTLATVPEAAIQALAAFPHTPIILLAGGYDRQQNFSSLAAIIADLQLRAVLLFRPTGERLAAELETIMGERFQPLPPHDLEQQPGITYYFYPEDMTAALAAAKRVAKPGDVVLLSPASASFGQFKDYADRSRQFAAAVTEIFS